MVCFVLMPNPGHAGMIQDERCRRQNIPRAPLGFVREGMETALLHQSLQHTQFCHIVPDLLEVHTWSEYTKSKQVKCGVQSQHLLTCIRKCATGELTLMLRRIAPFAGASMLKTLLLINELTCLLGNAM